MNGSRCMRRQKTRLDKTRTRRETRLLDKTRQDKTRPDKMQETQSEGLARSLERKQTMPSCRLVSFSSLVQSAFSWIYLLLILKAKMVHILRWIFFCLFFVFCSHNFFFFFFNKLELTCAGIEERLLAPSTPLLQGVGEWWGGQVRAVRDRVWVWDIVRVRVRVLGLGLG